jgi:hypothetical protein
MEEAQEAVGFSGLVLISIGTDTLVPHNGGRGDQEQGTGTEYGFSLRRGENIRRELTHPELKAVNVARYGQGLNVSRTEMIARRRCAQEKSPIAVGGEQNSLESSYADTL